MDDDSFEDLGSEQGPFGRIECIPLDGLNLARTILVSTNAAESFFAQLKRSIDGTHHHVSSKHLHRYLAEFDFRSTTKDISDGARMKMLLGQVDGRRLTYRPLASDG